LEYSGCAYGGAVDRKYDASLPMRPATDFPLPLGRRRWGPQNRNGLLFFKEVTPAEVLGGATPPTVLRSGPFQHEAVPGLRLRERTQVGDVTVDWVDGDLWIVGLDGQWDTNPFHWFSKVGTLYDARRANATGTGFGAHPSDGYIQWQSEEEIAQAPPTLRTKVTRNRAMFKVGPQWDLPSMDVVAFAGDGAVVLSGVSALHDWFASVLRLAAAPQSQLYFNDLISQYGPNKLLCARRGAIPSVKNKMFTGRADAWLFRQYAYVTTGLAAAGVPSHPHFPPRRVTILDRKGLNGRGIHNHEALVAAVEATGLPYDVVPSMGRLTFQEQVALMSRTGILIAPHGAALANSMFLPHGAVVIELFPYLMKKTTYRHLASLMDLHYMPVYSWELLPPDATQYYGVQLMNEMYFWEHCIKTNISSYDALSVHACNAASKNYPLVVPFPHFNNVLRDAVDSIGAFSLLNPAWAAVAEAQGIPVAPPPPVRAEGNVAPAPDAGAPA
jgi:hypothetical protein